MINCNLLEFIEICRKVKRWKPKSMHCISNYFPPPTHAFTLKPSISFSLSVFILWFRAVCCNCDVTARFLSNCQTNFKLLKVAAAAVAHNINIIITVAFWLLWCALKVFAQRPQVKSFLMKFCLLLLIFSMIVEGSTAVVCSCKYSK